MKFVVGDWSVQWLSVLIPSALLNHESRVESKGQGSKVRVKDEAIITRGRGVI